MDTDTVICRCEEVTLIELLNAIDNGAVSTKALKLQTRSGMGICQGKICRPLLEQIVSRHTNHPIPESPDLKSNHPVRPLRLSELADTERTVDHANK